MPMKRLLFFIVTMCLLATPMLRGQQIHFVFCSDLHYGLKRDFRGKEDVSAQEVCRVMADSIMALRGRMLPRDGGVASGCRIDTLAFVACGGDIANRMQNGVQTAAESWRQFEEDWCREGFPPLYLLPGNHDISNAIGYTKPLNPPADATCLVQIYNRMMKPSVPRTLQTYAYPRDNVRYAFTFVGVGFCFAGVWLDSDTRAWLADNLCDTIPYLLFTHAQPEIDARRFTNPRAGHPILAADGFQNVIPDVCEERVDEVPIREYAAAERFLLANGEIKAWFHGHENYNEFYRWHGVDGKVDMPVFRVDSPMKGEYSSDDESLLSFQMVSISPQARQMTVRTYFWNRDGLAFRWGDSVTVPLR